MGHAPVWSTRPSAYARDSRYEETNARGTQGRSIDFTDPMVTQH
jgi:hypothetical protein